MKTQLDTPSLVHLEALIEVLLDFSTLADLENWLAEQGKQGDRP